MPFEIRKYTQEEFQMIRDWGNKEGWNEGVYDYLAFEQIDKDGFWMGVLNGQPITSLCAVQYDQNFAFVGLYITKPQFRGKGYGFQVWKHALSRITAKNIALEGVLQQQHNYAKSGFKTSHRTIRYSTHGVNKHIQSQHIVECKNIDFEELCVYDRLNFPAERKEFLKKWISLPQSKAIAVVKEGKIQGYSVLRRSSQGYRIGPLFADSFQVANQILQNFLGSVSQQAKVSIDIPSINLEALKLAQQFKMVPGFVFARMYTNEMPNIQTYKTVYGVTSIQFG